MNLNINRHHIRHGIPNSGDRCPISLAIKEQYPDIDAIVTDDNINLFVYGTRLWADLPMHARVFLREFDSGAVDLHPFVLDLQLKDEPYEGYKLDQAKFQYYNDRIDYLTGVAEEEGISILDGSRECLESFVYETPRLPQCGIILSDNGYFVAVWETTDNGIVEVEFRGEGICKVVLFRNPKDPLRFIPEINTIGWEATKGKVEELVV